MQELGYAEICNTSFKVGFQKDIFILHIAYPTHETLINKRIATYYIPLLVLQRIYITCMHTHPWLVDSYSYFWRSSRTDETTKESCDHWSQHDKSFSALPTRELLKFSERALFLDVIALDIARYGRPQLGLYAEIRWISQSTNASSTATASQPATIVGKITMKNRL